MSTGEQGRKLRRAGRPAVGVFGGLCRPCRPQRRGLFLARLRFPCEPLDLASASEIVRLGFPRPLQGRHRGVDPFARRPQRLRRSVPGPHAVSAERSQQLQGAGGGLVGAGGRRGALQVVLQGVGIVQQPEDLRLPDAGRAEEGPAVEAEPA